jgi:hypothetical protein
MRTVGGIRRIDVLKLGDELVAPALQNILEKAFENSALLGELMVRRESL